MDSGTCKARISCSRANGKSTEARCAWRMHGSVHVPAANDLSGAAICSSTEYRILAMMSRAITRLGARGVHPHPSSLLGASRSSGTSCAWSTIPYMPREAHGPADESGLHARSNSSEVEPTTSFAHVRQPGPNLEQARKMHAMSTLPVFFHSLLQYTTLAQGPHHLQRSQHRIDTFN